MRKNLFFIMILIFSNIFLFGNINSGCAFDLSEMEKIIFEKINLIREKNGVNPLKYNEKLAQIALSHSFDMAKREYFSHYNPEGEGPVTRVRSAGLDDKLSPDGNFYFSVAENIGYVKAGYLKRLNIRVERTPHSLAVAQIKLWLESKPHKENMLNKNYEETGIGVAVDNKDNFYATQLFR